MIKRRKSNLYQLREKPICDQRGFSLPLAVGMGVTMMLMGATMIARSNVDRNASIAQNQLSNSITVAEAGINRTLAQLNQPEISSLLAVNYDGGATAGVLRDTAGGCSGLDTAGNTYPLNNTLKVINGTNQYQVRQYQYDANTQAATLTVSGQAVNNQPSPPRLQVTLNLQAHPIGLYALTSMNLSSANISTDSGTTVSANVVCQNCTVPNTATQCSSGMPTDAGRLAAVGSTGAGSIQGKAYLRNLNLPAVPTAPAGANQLNAYTVAGTQELTGGHYTATSINIPAGTTLRIKDTAANPVYIYVSGDVTIAGTVVHNRTNVTTTDNDGTPGRFVIFGTGTGATAQTYSIAGSTSPIRAFIYAPNANATLNRGATGTNPDVIGAIWARSITAAANFRLQVPSDMPSQLIATFGSGAGGLNLNTYNASHFTIYRSGAPVVWTRQEAP